MRIAIVAALILALAHTSEVRAGEGTVRVPVGARIRLEPNKTAWRLGENVIVRYIVENASDTPFKVETGGDGRAIRPVRTIVLIYDEQGQLVPDPTPNPPCFGGLCGSRRLTMSTPLVVQVPVLLYRLLAKPGRYTVRVFHDLGWGEDKPRLRHAERGMKYRHRGVLASAKRRETARSCPEDSVSRQRKREPRYFLPHSVSHDRTW